MQIQQGGTQPIRVIGQLYGQGTESGDSREIKLVCDVGKPGRLSPVINFL